MSINTPKDIFQRLVSFIEDNLLVANSSITHHGEAVMIEEKLSPASENL